MYRCPHCEEEIRYLNYQEDATNFGTYDIESEDYELDETEADGNLRYYCPKCDEEIISIGNLINTEEESPRENIDGLIPLPLDNNNDEERNLPIPPAITQEWNGEYSGFHNSNDTSKDSEILVCPFCNQKVEAIIDEKVECSNCNKEFNRDTAKKRIPIND